jgi:hypothetical protein
MRLTMGSQITFNNLALLPAQKLYAVKFLNNICTVDHPLFSYENETI